MAKFNDCIDKALSAGIIDKDKADELLGFDDPIKALDYAEGAIAQKKLQAARDALVFNELKADIESHPKGKVAGLLSTLVRDRFGLSGYRNVDKMQEARARQYFAEIGDVMDDLRTTHFGLKQDDVSLRELIQAVYGADNKMTPHAQKLKGLLDRIRLDFNRLGGLIRENEKYNLPQGHDLNKVKEVSLDEWRGYIKPMLDRELMTNDLGVKLSDEQLDNALASVYKSITTGGLNKIKGLGEKSVSMGGMGKKLANRHSEQRFLFFKDADGWINYHNKFGSGDALSTITSHIDSMANEIALMERFGSNPSQMFNTFQTMLKVDDETGMTLDWTWKKIAGYVDPNYNTAIANGAQVIRNTITSSTLGSAMLSSVFSDPLLTKMTQAYNDISRPLASEFAKLRTPDGRKVAARLGFILESQINSAGVINRFGDMNYTGKTGKLAELVMRGSGLAAWTDMLRTGFSMSYAGELADDFGKAFSDLSEKRLRQFKRYGIDESDWNTFRASKKFERDGATFADVTQEGGIKFHEMIINEMDIAVPTPDKFVQGLLSAGTSRGTVSGEMFKAFSSLKSYPISIITTHGYRAMFQTQGSEKLAYLANIFITGGILGGLTIQLKDIAAGREPRDVDGKFMAAALAQSGGLGIFGDFIFADQNRFGGSMANTLVGPHGELLDKVAKLTAGNVQQLVAGEDTDFVAELIDFSARYAPKVWWTRPLQNMIQEQAQKAVDSSTNERFRKQMSKRKKEFGQDYWWKKGSVLPEGLK